MSVEEHRSENRLKENVFLNGFGKGMEKNMKKVKISDLKHFFVFYSPKQGQIRGYCERVKS